jgi:hypothetical protein
MAVMMVIGNALTCPRRCSISRDHRLEDRDDLQRGDRRAPDLEPDRPGPDPAGDHHHPQHHRAALVWRTAGPVGAE